MAIKKVFVDDEGNEMQCFINTHNRIVLTSGVPENSEFYPYYAGLICLTKEDAEILISELRILIDEMQVNDPGFILLWRKFLFWEWYTDTNCKIVFLHCLLKANGEDKEWKGMIIKRGQFFTSIDHLSDELSLTSKQIRIALDKLEKGEEITTKGASKGTMITVCKYDTYQDYGQAEGQTKGEQSGKQRATTNYSILFNTVIDSNKIILNDEFKSLFLEWLKYKSEKRQSYKEIGLKNFLIKSLRDCGNDPEVLREMMLFSIANNYDGLFKERKNGFNKKDLGATPAEIAGSVGKYFASDRER